MEEENLLKPPHTQRFYIWLSYLMCYSGTGDCRWWNVPQDHILVKLAYYHRYVLYSGSFFTLISQLGYIYLHFHDMPFSVIGIVFTILPVNLYVIGIVVAALFDNYQKVMKSFVNETHLTKFYDGTPAITEIIIKAQKYKRYLAYYFIVISVIELVSWPTFIGLSNISRMEEVRNHTAPLHTMLYLLMPFDYEHKIKYFVWVHLMNTYIVLVATTSQTAFHTINLIVICNFIGHIKILKHKIRSIVFKDSSDEDIKTKLIEIIKYHTFLIRTHEEIESGLGLGFALTYIYNLVADSIFLVQIMIGDRNSILVYILMVVIFVGYLILISLTLEEIQRQTDDLPDMIYDWPWESLSLPNQQMVIMTLARVQPQLIVKASGGIITGVKPMISILKTTFSIYVMLKASVSK